MVAVLAQRTFRHLSHYLIIKAPPAASLLIPHMRNCIQNSHQNHSSVRTNLRSCT